MPMSTSAPAGAPTEAAPSCLERLHLRNFRNFRELRCEFPAAGAIVVGPNGAGKTNLLEAIYYLEIFRSFRGAPDRDLVHFGEDVFRIEAGMSGGGEHTDLAAAFQRTGRRKKVELGGTDVDRIANALGAFSAVVFDLDDAGLVSGSPGRRRRFLDIVLSLVVPGYLADLQRYRAVLGQRNEALRTGREQVVAAWTEGLVGPGAKLMAARAAWISDQTEGFGRYHEVISGGPGALLAYEAGLPGGIADRGGGDSSIAADDAGAVDSWEDRLRLGLQEGRERDMRRGFTTAGPHRDDLVIRAQLETEGPLRDLRAYGSGGQKRTAAIALRLVEADSLRAARGREPVYLLDDVFAELDRERAERVFRLLEDGRSGQVFLTAPKPADMPFRDGGLARWRLEDGVLVKDE
jgi:DNA replication and repair protein RecF